MAVDLKAQLAEAEAAYHRLMLGQGIAEFRDQNGETVKYTSASASRLRAYILELRSQLGISTGRTMGPGRPYF